jgi:hypothetical protein
LLINQACELYTKEKKAYFFALLSHGKMKYEEACDFFFSKLKEFNKKNRGSKIDIITQPAAEFKKRKYLMVSS